MGADKALLLLDGSPLIAHVLARLSPLFREIMIVGDSNGAYGRFGVPVVPDPRPDEGPLAAIRTALESTAAPVIFCCACDMPFIEPPLVERLIAIAGDGAPVVVPRLRGEPEPLCAVYGRTLLPTIEEVLASGKRSIRDVLDRAATRYVEEEELRRCDPELRSFINVNTPQDLDRARGMAP
jgi:molybdopterin-guanine dinucleotide biosynthesis protein A